MNQERIDAATQSKIGTTNAERGKSRKIMANLMVKCLEENAAFYEYFKTLFPKIGDFSTKSVESKAHFHECSEIPHKEKELTQHQANRIRDYFRQHFPEQYQKLIQYEHDWLTRLMNNNLPGMGAPFSKAYWDMIAQGAKFGYDSAVSDKSRPNPAMPPIPFVVNPGEDFIKKIYADGYGLVSSKITLEVATPAMELVNQSLLNGKSWTEITDELAAQFGGMEYHWERLVRSEMAMAANAGTMAQARALNEPSAVIKWSTAAGSVCPICAPRNGRLYALDAPEVTSLLPHPNCMCARVITFRKREREE